MARKITIDILAVMMKKGFDGVDKCFNEVDKRFNEVDKRFDEVEKRLDRIENFLLKRHENEIENLKIRVKHIEDLFAMPAGKK